MAQNQNADMGMDIDLDLAGSPVEGPPQNAVCYPMERGGNVYIFNQGKSDSVMNTIDKKNITETFEAFGFQVWDVNDSLSKEKLKAKLKEGKRF